MDWRLAGFLTALLILAGLRAFRFVRPDSTFVAEPVERWSLWKLTLASFLTLFAELSLIRWIATEVRIFAYVKNLALLLCFLGFGLGCALSKTRTWWRSSAIALLGLLMIVRLPHYGPRVFEGLSQGLGAGQGAEIWATGAVRNWTSFLIAGAITSLLLLLITYVFVPLGQTVSRQIELASRPLHGYSWNLAASLAGILAFFAVCGRDWPPAVWLGIVFLGLALLQENKREQIIVASFVIAAVLLLHDVNTPLHFSLWTPYQQLQVDQTNFPGGEFGQAMVKVNHVGYQMIDNLSPEFLARHPELLKERPENNPYNLPFRFARPQPKVLIVGSGTGNDVAAAVRNRSRAVDAVEIDPAILELGKRLHPERPYSSPIVSVHLTDARAFLKRARPGYDLALFGLLDSHTQLSDYSNMRIDNFVYTRESFQEVRDLLAPKGVLFVKFQVDHPWLGRRLFEMLTEVFGKKPVVLNANSSYTAGASCFAISPSDQVDEALRADPRLAEFTARNQPAFLQLPPVEVTTDDWPYLYQQSRQIPGVFLWVSVLVAILACLLYWQIPGARDHAPSLFFFSMGAGFLLLETQIISRLALYFGTTWQVNGIVIGALLTALLIANAIMEHQQKSWSRWRILGGLLAGLALAYFFPFERLPGSASLIGWIAAAVFSIPVFFAGLLFASEFRNAQSPSAALAANMLGAVLGGLLENLSLVIGMRALLVVAFALYSLAGLGLRRRSAYHAAGLAVAGKLD